MDDIKRPTTRRSRTAEPMRRRFDAPIIRRQSRTGGGASQPPIASPRTSRITIRLTLPSWVRFLIRHLRSYMPSRRKHPQIARVGWGLLAMLMLATVVIDWTTLWQKEVQYGLSPKAQTLLSVANPAMASKLKFNAATGDFLYNEGYKPGVVGGPVSPKFIAHFNGQPERGTTITDPVTQTSVTFKPVYKTQEPRQDKNRLVYPLKGQDGVKVYSLKSIGMKEDIILESYQGDTAVFRYTLELSDGTEARLESNGALAIYGAQKELLGNVSTGSEKDAELLKKARENSPKKTLLFTFPAPFVREFGKDTSAAKAWFELRGKALTLHASGLRQATYPLSIDPSVYIETAAQLMRGNNETNTDFDIDDQLIQKSQTTGARIDAWEDNLDMNQATWDHGATAAGGYVYRVGGRSGPAKPTIVTSATTTDSTDGTSFTMNMPATRPAGDLYIAMFCHDGSNGSNMTGPSGGGWTEFADLQGYAAYWKVGTDQGGGSEAATYQWTGPSEKYAGVIVRITGFDAADPVSGTPGTGSNASAVTPVFPATTPDNDATLVVRGVGADEDVPSDTGWVPVGHTKIASGNSGSTGDCGFASAALDMPPASGVSTGTATLADTSLSDDYGASSIAINPTSVTPSMQSSVYWAKFNSSTLAIESPNPGAGACSGWCNNAAYNLPEARRGHAVVAYNGYLYVIGGSDGTNLESTVLIAKLGANGELQKWHPTDTNPTNWVYWYQDTGLNGGTARAYHAVYAYKNKMYVLGGDTNTTANSGSTTTVELADILPNGRLGSWSSGQALPASTGRYGHTVHVYNDTMYVIGGNNNGTLLSSVYYSKLNSDGTMNAWVQTTGFTTARSTQGGNFTTVWGAYIYLSGGCTAVNASGYCTTVASDTQLASINADGSISEWGSINNLQNQRLGYSILGWQNGLYRLGGCAQQNTTNGECRVTLADVDFGVINPAGEVSTVNLSVPSGSGTCTGVTAYNCDLPPTGDDAGEGGQMLSMSAIMNGYLYVIGGCIGLDCTTTDPDNGDDTALTGNTSYVAIDSNGRLTAPGSCAGTSYGAWCTDAVNRINTTTGVAAAGVTTFNGRIYIVGGLDTSSDGSTEIYYNSTNANGSLAGAWSNSTFASAGLSGQEIAYTYAYARANPASAGSSPGNLYIFGGCGDVGAGAGCSSSSYRSEVYKCNIGTTGAVTGCTTTGQLQIDSELADETDQGLGIHSGTVYANYIYLIGGFSANVADRDTVFYAKFDNSNNVVSVTTSAAGGNNDDWILSGSTLSVGRRRGFSFGYNGHIYSVGGYEDTGTTIIPFIEWSKMNVSNGSIDPFQTSNVTINQRWGLSMVVSNSYAYVIGGCDNGASPGSCVTFENSVQTFQLYNNDSGAVQDFTAQSDQTFAANTDRWGISSAIYNGYLYVAGGCISATDCTDATNNVQYAPISASDGTIGTWTSGGNLPADRAWGSLEVAGGTLYYIGGQDDTATNEQSTVYYTSGISSGNPTWNGTAAANGLPGARTKFSSAVWNNRLYVVGGLDGNAAVSSTVYVSPQLNSGGNINSAWASTTAFNVARTGAAVTAYANNLYLFGGFDGTNYLNDVQFTQINSDGTVDGWLYTTSLPGPLRDAQAVSANGYIYLVGGRSAASTCTPNTLITPVSANTTIATGNNPTGIGEWYETNVRYTGDRYGSAVSYDQGKLYVMGGGCTAPLAANRHYYSTVKSQPQVAKYSRLIDTDTDVFPNSWLMNGIDNSIGARWQVRYRSMNDTDGVATDCGTADMTTWGQETNYGDVALSDVAQYVPRDGSGNNINCARYFYFFISIDASKTFGYPEDVTRGPTMTDLSLFFSSDPSKRLRHGKTFTGGERQPFDTPCRQSVDADCPLP
jgi:hypothetical protein